MTKVNRGKKPVDEEIAPTPDALPHLGLRERKKRLAQAAIEDAALRLFLERGYEQTAIQDIAEAVMMSPRTFFRYFASKEEVLFAPTKAIFNAAFASLQQRPSSEPLDTVLYATFDQIATLYQQQWTRFVMLYQIIRDTPALESAMFYYLGTLEPVLYQDLLKHTAPRVSARRLRLLVATAMAAFRVTVQDLLESQSDENLVSLVHKHLELLLNGQVLSDDSC
jgi:AcrR family transcriptional regulator